MSLITISVTPKFRERFERLVHKGQRSEFIARSVNKELDALEIMSTIRREREQWLIENIVPIIREILKDKTDYEMLEYYGSERIKYLLEKVKSAVCEISEEHMMFAIGAVRNERRRQD
jgi:predicted ATP-binding protein involved in virulence